MTRLRYEELLDDRLVYRTNHELEFQCISCCKRYSVGVYYNPPDLMSSDSSRVRNKPFLGIFPNAKFNNALKPIIKNEQIFLMFSEFFEKAFTFRLTIDCNKGEAFLKVLDMPNDTDPFITAREITGISKTIHPDHVKFLAPREKGSFGY